MKYHELANIFPIDDGESLDRLAEDIKINGLNRPIRVLDEKILDGRRRFMACLRADVTPTFQAYQGKDPLAFVISENLHRRHLDDSQRAMVAANIANLKVGRPSGGKDLGNNRPQKGAIKNSDAAAIMNVSEHSVERAKSVIANGTPSLQKAVEQGVVTVTDAAAVSKETPAVQNAAVKKVRKKKAKTVKDAATSVKGDADEGELEKITDAVGTEVPADAVQAFQAAKDIETLCRDIDALNHRVSAAAKLPGWELVNADSVMQTFKNLRQNLWSSRATHVCPYCKGKGKTCSCCKGKGWTIKAVFNQAPPS